MDGDGTEQHQAQEGTPDALAARGGVLGDGGRGLSHCSCGGQHAKDWNVRAKAFGKNHEREGELEKEAGHLVCRGCPREGALESWNVVIPCHGWI